MREGRKEGNRNEWKTVGKKEIKHERCKEQSANIEANPKWEEEERN
jgi:hypothetical protein